MKSRCFLIKSASGACNMRCSYCFYRDEASERSIKNYGMMTPSTVDILIKRAFEETDGGVSFAFQGGEPTLSGLDFFRHFVEVVKSYGRKNVSFAFQTNGYLIDHAWAEFLRENNFLVGLSLDGNKKIHDLYRKGNDGEGSYKKVFRASQIMSAEGVKYNILVTVTRAVAENINELFPFFERNNLRYLQFIPCIDPIGEKGGEYSLTNDVFLRFLKDLFSLYYDRWKRGQYVSIRYFDNLVKMTMGNPPEECGLGGVCSDIYYVIEADGSVFPCDFYVLDGYEIGNIRQNTLDEIDRKRREIRFVEKSMDKDEECLHCPVFSLCRGGCRREREDFSSGVIARNRLCASYKEFLTFAKKGLEEIAYWEKRALGR